MLATITLHSLRERWRGTTIGAVTVGLFLLAGMAAYREIDVSMYEAMPEAMRALFGIPEGADAASLAYGAIYAFYGALILASFALAGGAAAVAGEERRGTAAMLLGSPLSRTRLVAAKTLSLVALTAFGALLLWVAGVLSPRLLDVDVSGMNVEALLVHVFAISLFHGCLALAIGAWAGSTTMASGITSGVLVLSFFAVGLLPLIEGAGELARIFPWYYLDGADPVRNGVHWGHVGLLLGGSALLVGAAVVGVNRRDLVQSTTSTSLLDRLRENPIAQRLVERLAGSVRVSRLWIKTATDHQTLTFITALTMFWMMGVMMGPIYAAIDDTLSTFASEMPEALVALVGGGDMSTPEGYYQVETFSMMAPVAVMAVTIVLGARALAGEEGRRTMGLLLANPLPRWRVIVDKTIAMVLLAVVVGVATFAGVAAGSALAGLGISLGGIAAASALVTLLGLVFGGLALALGAATGSVRIAAAGSAGVAFAAYLLDSFLPLSDRLASYAQWSPFHYYLRSDPLNNGMAWDDGAILAGLFVVLVGAAVVLFHRRDLRSG